MGPCINMAKFLNKHRIASLELSRTVDNGVKINLATSTNAVLWHFTKNQVQMLEYQHAINRMCTSPHRNKN